MTLMPRASSILSKGAEIPPHRSTLTPRRASPSTLSGGSVCSKLSTDRRNSRPPSKSTTSNCRATSNTGETRPFQSGTAILISQASLALPHGVPKHSPCRNRHQMPYGSVSLGVAQGYTGKVAEDRPTSADGALQFCNSVSAGMMQSCISPAHVPACPAGRCPASSSSARAWSGERRVPGPPPRDSTRAFAAWTVCAVSLPARG